MFRFISFLLIMAGLAALSYGGYQYYQSELAAPKTAAAPPGSVGFDGSPSQPVISRSSNTRDLAAEMEAMVDDEFFGAESADLDIMNSLRTVPIAHETPKSAVFGRPFTVSVAVDATGDDTAADALSGTGNIVEGEAQISSSVQAFVSGPAFDVEAITPSTQRISPLTENVWRWKVTPNAVGSQELVIELFAIMEDEALPLRTFRDSVNVEVSRIGQVIAIAKSVSPITVVAGGIGSLLAGLFGFIGFFRR
ncbi:MAG: hypothetical protein AAGL11_08360 [Pseudomonadota bacterium]